MSPSDRTEFAHFNRVLNPKNAGSFADEYRHRQEYGMYVLEMYAPDGSEAVINEFNFKDEEVAKAALAAVNALAPVKE